MRLRAYTRDDVLLVERWRTEEPAWEGEHGDFGWHAAGALLRRFDEDGLLPGGGDGHLVVVLPGDTLVGDVSWHWAQHGPTAGSRLPNIGIGLRAEHRGKGYGTSAQRQLAAYLFAHFPVNRVEASTDVTNHGEQRALEKAGFTREGVLRGAQWRAGGWHDCVGFSRLRDD